MPSLPACAARYLHVDGSFTVIALSGCVRIEKLQIRYCDGKKRVFVKWASFLHAVNTVRSLTIGINFLNSFTAVLYTANCWTDAQYFERDLSFTSLSGKKSSSYWMQEVFMECRKEWLKINPEVKRFHFISERRWGTICCCCSVVVSMVRSIANDLAPNVSSQKGNKRWFWEGGAIDWKFYSLFDRYDRPYIYLYEWRSHHRVKFLIIPKRWCVFILYSVFHSPQI